MAEQFVRPKEFGVMYPEGHVIPGAQSLGFWPPDKPIKEAKYIFAMTPEGPAINSRKTGKTLVLTWHDFGKLAEAEGLLIEDTMPEGLKPSDNPGLPGDRQEERDRGRRAGQELGAAGAGEERGGTGADPSVGPAQGTEPLPDRGVAGYAGPQHPG
jgi:hypothetical protein